MPFGGMPAQRAILWPRRRFCPNLAYRLSTVGREKEEEQKTMGSTMYEFCLVLRDGNFCSYHRRTHWTNTEGVQRPNYLNTRY